jgi:uncharacterized glyoxalase superfamily protein PhnB
VFLILERYFKNVPVEVRKCSCVGADEQDCGYAIDQHALPPWQDRLHRYHQSLNDRPLSDAKYGRFHAVGRTISRSNFIIGGVHLAIHSNEGCPGVPTQNAQSPAIVFGTSNVRAVFERLSESGVETRGPSDHGFGLVVSFRDPDGNFVEVLQEYEEPYEMESAASVGQEAKS